MARALLFEALQWARTVANTFHSSEYAITIAYVREIVDNYFN